MIGYFYNGSELKAQMKPASETVLRMFQSYCDEFGKLFLPEPRQNDIIDSLTGYYSKYYSLDVLEKCVREYVKTSPDPILVYNFALDSSKIRDKVVELEKSNKNFERLVKETEQRMREFDEL
jgi:hypothetical protein